MFAGFAVAEGLSPPDPPPAPTEPEDPVATVEGVDDGDIAKAEFDASLEQVASQQGLQKVPATDDPQYGAFRDQALGDVLLTRWIRGEAEDRGVTLTEPEVEQRLDEVKEQSFKTEGDFVKFAKQSGFCTEEELAAAKDGELVCEGLEQRVELMILSQKIQEDVLGTDPQAAAAAIPDDEVEDYYEENKSQFSQPETRDVRLILNQDAEKVQQAAATLQRDNSPQSWRQVAKQYSTDQATRNQGGVRNGVVEGQGDPEFEEPIFAAEEGEMVGPFETAQGTYLVQVDKVTPAETTPLSEVEEQIRQQLASAEQDELARAFEEDFVAKWRAETVCAEGYVIDRCSNASPPPDACTEEQAESETGCPPPVPSTRPAVAGGAGVIGQASVQGLPQGPLLAPAPEAAPGTIPPGATPVGPPGAPPPGTPAPPPQGGAAPPPAP